jgi:hypothetical protein
VSNRAALALSAVGLLLLYVLLFAPSTGAELSFSPRWAIRFDNPALSVSAEVPDGDVIPFETNRRIGYVGVDGELVHLENERFGSSLADSSYINYPRIGDTYVIQNRRGGLERSVRATGYPLLRGDRLLLIDFDGRGIEERAPDDQVLWRRRTSTLITALDTAGGVTALGMAGGRVLLLDAAGEPLLDVTPFESRIPVVYGVSLSESGDALAAVVGIDPQFLVVYRRLDDGYSMDRQIALNTDLRRSVYLDFVEGGRLLVHEADRGLALRDFSLGRVSLLPGIEPRSPALALSAPLDVVVAAAQDLGSDPASSPAGGLLRGYSRRGREVFSLPGAGSADFLFASDRRLIVGTGDALIAFDLEVQ